MEDKNTVLLCGAARGLGHKIAQRFLVGSWNVVVLDLSPGEIADPIYFLKCDVSNFQETEMVISKVLASHQRIDALVNCIRYRKPKQESSNTPEQWKKALDIDLHTYFNASFIVCEAMKRNNTGCSVVNISSILSELVNLNESITYHAAKAAIQQITRYLAVQYGPYQIRVNSVAPGLISNEKSEKHNSDPASSLYARMAKHVPLRRSGDPKEVAELVYFLASAASSFITGENIVIDGGLSISEQCLLIASQEMERILPPLA